MTLVVTGAAGFLGSHLVEVLAGDGEDVVAIDRRAAAVPRGVRMLRSDLLNGDPVVATILRRAATVFHLAGAPGVRSSGAEAARRRQRDNVLATARLFELVPVDTPVVVTSSSSVYGGTTDGRASHEEDDLRPRGGYAASKAAVERLCHDRNAAGGTVTIARPFSVAGERQRADMALATWIAAVAEGRPVRIIGSAGNSRDVTDVRDVVAGLRRLGAVRFRGHVNIGSGTSHTLAAMLEAVCDCVGAPARVERVPAAPDEPRMTLADTDRFVALTGIRPHTDLAAVVRRQAGEQLRAR
jgi:nucleoside-diphosphate-sugar epimerase